MVRDLNEFACEISAGLVVMWRLQNEIAHRLSGAAGDQFQNASRRAGPPSLDEMDKGPRYVVSCELGQAQSGIDPRLPYPIWIDGYS